VVDAGTYTYFVCGVDSSSASPDRPVVSPMLGRRLRHITRRHVAVAALLAGLALASWLGVRELATRATWEGLLEEVAAIEAAEPSPVYRWRTWSFDYRDTTCTVTVRYDPAELERAREIDTSRVFGTRLWLREAYVSNLVVASAESRFIEGLAEEFRTLREDLALDDSEYLELMVRAVQAIPYGEVEGEILLPIEVIADGNGVCSEKSILLAALLVHEDYDTVVWVFETQGHAAVGVGSNGATYGSTDYAFIETTRYAFVGQVSPEFASRGPIAKVPEMIRVGGEKTYTAGVQVDYILDQLDEAELHETFWSGYPEYAEQAITPAHKTRFAQRAKEYHDATSLTRYVMDNTHDRAVIYAELLARNSEMRPGR
jgi:hypothetical protein